jgi:arsenate reductase
MRVVPLTKVKEQNWDRFVEHNPIANMYHLVGWKAVFEKVFGYTSYYFMAENQEEDIAGILPMFCMRDRVRRKYVVSHPCCKFAGICARSPLAEGRARSLAPDGVVISSAGSAPSRVSPFAIRALEEVGIDASVQRSKGTDDIRQSDGPGVDAVITLCAEEVCPVWLGEAYRVDWPLPDPAVARGSDEEIQDSFRGVRDELRRRLTALFEPPSSREL